MKRRDFVGKNMIVGGMVTPAAAMSQLDLKGKKSGISPDPDNSEEVFIERSAEGRPHEGLDTVITGWMNIIFRKSRAGSFFYSGY